MNVLLDTNFIVAAVENKIDLMMELRKFGPPELYVIDLVVNELEKLSEGRGKDSKNASVALQFLGRSMVNVIKAGEGNTDMILLKVAEKRGMSVCTIDRKLRDTLLGRNIKVITIRQSRYLVLAKKHGVDF